MDLSRALESSRQTLAAAGWRVGAPSWSSQLSALTGSADGGFDRDGRGTSICDDREADPVPRSPGDRQGFLFELFELRHGPNDTYFHALASLLCKRYNGSKRGDTGVGSPPFNSITREHMRSVYARRG